MTTAGAARSFWGWGDTAAALTESEERALIARVAPLLGGAPKMARPPTRDEIELSPSRVTPPASLDSICTVDTEVRAGHTYGKSFRDVVRALERSWEQPPDVVAYPGSESQVTAILDWATTADVVVIPYGGGSSVVGGVEAPAGDRPVVSLDLAGLSGVREIDRTSRAARIGGGTLGPDIEASLRPHGLTLRHYPQSFEFSTLGGWLATRSGGHFATLHTHLDDFVESIRAITPRGAWESRRLPGSGAGPSPDRMLLGSEGTLGVITEAWMRLQDQPAHRASFVARFASFTDGARAARDLAQSGLWPQNCRLVDATEAWLTGAGDGSAHLLLVAFESGHHPVADRLPLAAEIVRAHGADLADDQVTTPGTQPRRPADDASDRWRATFLRAPYIRDGLVRLGLVNETVETAITWDRFDEFVDGVRAAVTDALITEGCGPSPILTCRLTHVYPDGAAPYFTVIAPGRPGLDRLRQWNAVKAAAMDAIDRLGGTVTHHHAVGRDHRPGYDRQRSDVFADAFRAAKRAVDPGSILNPGVLIDP